MLTIMIFIMLLRYLFLLSFETNLSQKTNSNDFLLDKVTKLPTQNKFLTNLKIRSVLTEYIRDDLRIVRLLLHLILNLRNEIRTHLTI